jgi:hypothetical protein
MKRGVEGGGDIPYFLYSLLCRLVGDLRVQLAICPLRKAKALGAFKRTWIGEFTSKNDLSTCFFLSFILVLVARMNVRFYWKKKYWAFFMEGLNNYLCKSWYADWSILCEGRCITASFLLAHKPQTTMCFLFAICMLDLVLFKYHYSSSSL